MGVILLYNVDGMWLKQTLGVVLLLVAVCSLLKEFGILKQRPPSSSRNLGTQAPNTNAAGLLQLSVPADVVDSNQNVEIMQPATNGNLIAQPAYDPCTSAARAIAVSSVGLTSGLLGGLFACSGPPNMVFV